VLPAHSYSHVDAYKHLLAEKKTNIVATPRAWNRLLTDLKLLRSTASFKSKLGSFLFYAAYTGNTV